MVLGVVLSLLGIGTLLGLIFSTAILALPLFIAVVAGWCAYGIGAGELAELPLDWRQALPHSASVKPS